MSDHSWTGIGADAATFTGGTLTTDLVTSTGYSLNALASYFWRGLGVVDATLFSLFQMGAAGGTKVVPSWGGVTLDTTGGTNARMLGLLTPVSQSTWGALHKMRIRVQGLTTTYVHGIGVRISGGTDMYCWGRSSAGGWYREHETAGVPGVTLVLANDTGAWEEVDINVPARASEATAGVVSVHAYTDGSVTPAFIDSLSIAPSHTGLVSVKTAGYGASTIIAHKWVAQ